MRMSSCFFSSRLKMRISAKSDEEALQHGVAERAGATGDQQGLVFEHIVIALFLGSAEFAHGLELVLANSAAIAAR